MWSSLELASAVKESNSGLELTKGMQLRSLCFELKGLGSAES